MIAMMVSGDTNGHYADDARAGASDEDGGIMIF